MRKLLLSLASVLFMAGLVVAAEVTLVRYDKDKKELTVKDDDGKETTYRITDKTKFSQTGKDGTSKDLNYEGAEKRLTNEKAVGKAKLDITTSGKDVTEIKFKGFGGKKQDK
jgi:hypothetical protein